MTFKPWSLTKVPFLGGGVQFLSKAKVANMVDPLQSIVGSLS